MSCEIRNEKKKNELKLYDERKYNYKYREKKKNLEYFYFIFQLQLFYIE